MTRFVACTWNLDQVPRARAEYCGTADRSASVAVGFESIGPFDQADQIFRLMSGVTCLRIYAIMASGDNRA